MKRIVFFTVIIFLTTWIFADEIILVNGDVLHGTIVSLDEDKVILQTEYGKIEILRSKMKSGTLSGGSSPGTSSIATAPVSNKNSLLLEMLFENNLASSVNNSFSPVNKNNAEFTYGYNKAEKSALYSNGTGKYVVLENTKIIDTCSEMTISFWAFTNDNTKLQYFLSKWTSTTGEQAEGKFAVCTTGGSVFFYIVGEEGKHYSFFAVNVLPVRTWTHITLCFSKGDILIYINGEIKAQTKVATTRLANDSSSFYLLTAKSNTENPFAYYNLNGAIDDLRIYNSVLSEEKVKALIEQAAE